MLIDRCQKVQGKNTHTFVTLILIQLLGYIDATEVDNRSTGHMQIVIVPTINVTFETTEFLKEADRWCITNPAPRNQHIAVGINADRYILTGSISQGRRMDKTDMGGIHQVLGNIQVVGFQVQGISLMGMPTRIVKLRHVEHLG